MASITIRNLDDWLKRRLRVRAAEHGRSMEEEAREILREAVGGTSAPKNLGTSHSRPLRGHRWRRAGASRARSDAGAAIIPMSAAVLFS